MMQQAIQQGGDGRGVAESFAPVVKLVETVVTSFLCHTKERKVADRVTLVLPHRLARSLDLNSIKI